MTDAHCHPWDLLSFQKNAEEERKETGTAAAASSWNLEDFLYHEGLAKKAREQGAPPLFCCFALHPQLAPEFMEGSQTPGLSLPASLDLLRSLAAEDRLAALGETGFDLYNEKYRAAEKIQDEIFACHLETALQYNLPVVLHVRRAMHKIFPFAKELKKLPAVVFHSWPGTSGEGEALLKRGINAYFSFGAVVLKNHKEAIASAVKLPLDRVLLETDAPYQPLRGKEFSTYRDLNAICSCIAALRKEAGSITEGSGGEKKKLEDRISENFFKVFSG